MGQILGNHRYKISDDETFKSLKRIRQLKSSLKIIREEYMNQLTLGNLAEAADMSPKYFCRFFSEMTGKTPIEYLNYYRIECAAEQLLYTDDLVTDIALNCGYNDLSYFVKTFKKYKAQTPKQFRKTIIHKEKSARTEKSACGFFNFIPYRIFSNRLCRFRLPRRPRF